MLDGLKPYPAYKESGVPWLGRIPDGWSVERNGRLFARRNENGTPDLPILEVSLRTGVRIRGFADGGRKQVMADLAGYRRAAQGDIAYNTMRMWQGAVGVVPTTGLVSPAYVVACPIPGSEPGYFTRLFRTAAYLEQIDGYSRGIVKDRNRLYWEDFKRIPTAVPPPEEQTLIVRFFDSVDHRIRHLLREKQKLVSLLEEQRKTILGRAVTSGPDTRCARRPFTSDRHAARSDGWAEKRVKDVFHCLNSRRSPLSGTERGAMTLRRYDYYGASGVIDRVDDFLFDDELILLAEDGANLVLRNLPLAIIATGKLWVNNHAHILKPRDGNLEFLAALLETIDYGPWISGAAQPKLTQDRLMSVPLAVPPRAEQDRIMQAVRAETASLAAAISSVGKEESVLRELRTRLIADVVTGKLDVRKAAEQLPEETDTPDATEYDETETPAENDSDDGLAADSASMKHDN